MNGPRTTIAGLMAATGLVAIAAVALRDASEAWASFAIGMALIVPAAGVLGAIGRGRRRRAGCPSSTRPARS